jgi:hypothetical protein
VLDLPDSADVSNLGSRIDVGGSVSLTFADLKLALYVDEAVRRA